MTNIKIDITNGPEKSGRNSSDKSIAGFVRHFRRKLLATAGSMVRSSSGSTATAFSLSVIPLLLVAGAGVDITQTSSARNDLTQATDAVALASAKQAAAGVTGTALQTYAGNFLAATSMGSAAALAGYPSVDSTTGEVCVKTTMPVKTTLMSIAGIKTITVSANSCAQVAAGTFEIALVLDTTGSMGSADNGGQSKLTSMKNAANSFIDSMYDSAATGPRTKMSVVPFAPSVNVGTTYATASWMDTTAQSSWHWKSPMFATDNTIASNRFALYTLMSAQNSGWAWGGCVESLPYPLNVSDAAPTASNADSKFVPMLAPDEPANPTHTVTSTKNGKTTTTTVTDATYNNSYLDDKGFCSTTPANDNTTATQTTAQSRLCKYKQATGKVTSSGYGPNAFCVSKPLVRLQTTKAALKTTVTSLTAGGTTNIHEGFMWGWRTISPNAPFADGRPYGTANNNKVIVLMTDGQNTWYSAANALNGSDYSAYGHYNSANGKLPPTNQNVTTDAQARDAMDKLVKLSCDAAKAQNVKIYTIAFSVNSDPMDAQALALLQYCASKPEYYYAPNSQATLNTAFAAIGSSIGTLRVTK